MKAQQIDPTNSQTPDELDGALRQMLNRLVLRDHVHGGLLDLPPSQFRCLAAVARHPGRKMAEIAELVGITLPALSQVVTRLVRSGLIMRREDPSDRRVFRLELTDTAQSLMQKHIDAKRERIKEVSRRLSQTQCADIIKALKLLTEAAERVDAETGPESVAMPDPVIVKIPVDQDQTT